MICTTSLGGWWSGVAGSLGVRAAASIGSFGGPDGFFSSRSAQPGPWEVRWAQGSVLDPWSEPWNGEGGTSGSSVQLGSVEWTANAPTRSYITIHRCLVTRAGRARGVEPADLLRRVLALAGLTASTAQAGLAGADPR
jgi:hypothetical protein